MWRPRKALRGGISKSILHRPCQFLAMNAHKMAPRTRKRFQERGRDTLAKGLLWGVMLPEKKEFKLPWREACSPNHHDDVVDFGK